MYRLLKQIWSKPPLPTADFSNQTIIVTGANVGIGKEAVKHFVRRGATRVVATVRSTAKGEAALAEIEADTQRLGVVEIWELEYASYDSVKDFCARVAQLDRVDAVVLNAGVATTKFEIFEGDETCITVNVISTTLLALLLLPILRASAVKWNIVPTLAVTGSGIHKWAQFPERDAVDSLAALNAPDSTSMRERYSTTKLLQLLAVREIAGRTADKKPFVIVNTISPGLCSTDLGRSATGTTAIMLTIMLATIAWRAEEGARTLIHATIAGPKSHGVLLDECKIENGSLAPWILTEEGKKVQQKIWKELALKLEVIQPGVTKDL